MELKTPLYDTHVRCGGKIVPFGGYLLPVNYGTGIKQEHMSVRERAGLFDVSHMGELVIKGPDALKNLNYLFTNYFSNMVNGQIRYTISLYESGGAVDDLLVYKVADDDYLLVVNASNKDKDYEWIKQNISGDVVLSDISDKVGQVALQGPCSFDILKKLIDESVIPQKYYTFSYSKVLGVDMIISRTGYTGEDGFELYCNSQSISVLWDALMEAGKEYGLIPCGLGARDTLRLEAAMPLYGHELTKDITPIQAGLKFFVKMDKPDFIGKDALIALGEPDTKRVGLEIIDRGIAREHDEVFSDGVKIGDVTSGTMVPYLGKSIAMAYIKKDFSSPDTVVEVSVRGKLLKAKVVKLPFYKRA